MKESVSSQKFCVLRVLDIGKTRDLILCLHSAVQTLKEPYLSPI